MRVERVSLLGVREIEAEPGLRAELADAVPHGRDACLVGAVLGREHLPDGLLARRGRGGVELEAVPRHDDVVGMLELGECVREVRPADSAPRARDIGPDVDGQGSGHAEDPTCPPP